MIVFNTKCHVLCRGHNGSVTGMHGVNGRYDFVLIMVDGFQQEVEPRAVGFCREMSTPVSQVTVSK